MPLKLGQAKVEGDPFIDKAVIKKMVTDYLNGIGGISTDRLRLIYPSRPDIQEAKCCAFPVSELLKLIADNGDVDAIRVYYGVHDDKNCPANHPEYEGLHNVILVACKNIGTVQNPIWMDLLKDDVNYVSIPGFRNDGDGSADGDGADMGNLCPPNSGCQGTTIP